MKIRRLYIGDMGIYRNALMDNIAPGIVVIGGLNRSGKTTLLEILRHMPYGFTKNLRNTAVEYSIESDLEDGKGDLISLRLNGLKEPQLSLKGNTGNITIKELYGDIDKFTYSQLFTISLEELKKLNIKGEEEKLQAVLLGAGISDIVHIPKLLESISNEKNRIGGKVGNPNVKQFKIFYDKVLKGLETKEEALRAVEKYNLLQGEEVKLSEEISILQEEIRMLKDKPIFFHDASNYTEAYKDMASIKQEIQILEQREFKFDFQGLPTIEKVETLYEEYLTTYNYNEKLRKVFEQNSCESNINYKELLKSEDKIKQYIKNASGLRQRQGELVNLKLSYEEQKENILKQQYGLNSTFKGNFIEILNIDCDFINEAKLVEALEEIITAKNESFTWKANLESECMQGEAIKEELITMKYNKSNFFKSHLYASLAILLLSIGVYFINKAFAFGVLLTGVTSIGLYYFIKQSTENQLNGRRMNMELELKASENKQNIYKEKLQQLQSKELKLNKGLSYYKQCLKLSEEVPENFILPYFKNIKELKGKIINLGNLGKKIEQQEKEIKLEFEEIYNCLKEFTVFSSAIDETTPKYFFEVFQVLETIDRELGTAREYNNSNGKLILMEDKLIEKLKLQDNEEDLVEAAASLLEEYGSFNKLKTLRLKYSLNKLETLKEELQLIKMELNNLATSEKLQEAQSLIDEGRLGLKPLVEKYSIFHAAEYILETVQKDFLDNARHKLLKGAGDIFSKITSGQYKAVLPGDNLLQNEYKTIREKNSNEESASMLSRGTGEQLYLSVRLNRIKSMEQKLPIIFDDAFVNFDELHVKNTLEILLNLSQENQIFILTCHAEIVKLLSNLNKDVQYWKLVEGSFKSSNSKELFEYLST